MNVVCEGEGENIEEMIGKVKEKLPSFATVGNISTEYSDYTGEFVSFERTNGDVPKEATLGDMIGVMKSFDAKAETLVVILSDMNGTLKSVKEDTSSMLEKQDKMLDKQDTTIQILRSVKEDTSQIREDTSQIKDIKEDTGIMKDKLTSLEEIHRDVLDLREKYDQLSDDVAGLKIMISGHEADCVFD